MNWFRWIMPSFRDLRGRPVDEEVNSRIEPPPTEVLRDAVDATDIREATRRVREARDADPTRRPRVPVTDKPIFSPPGQAVPEVDLPEDFEAALQALEGSLLLLREHVTQVNEAIGLAQQQITGLRLRAQKDRAKLVALEQFQQALRA